MILIAYLSSNLQIQDHDLSQKMILIFKRLDAFIDPQNEKLRHLIEALACLPSQGLDLQNEKVFETNHPYERSKVQHFDPVHFPGAIAIAAEFDRRCQSDSMCDFFTIFGYYDEYGHSAGGETPLSFSFIQM